MRCRGVVPLVMVGVGTLSSTCPFPARANPCALEYVAGRHVYVGAPQKDVFIDDETLQFRAQRTPLDGFIVEISVAYTLVNRGPARSVVIGFPVGGAKLSSFRVAGEGVGGRVLPSAEEQASWKKGMELSRCELEPLADSAQSPFEWYLWNQALGAGTNRFQVHYVQRWNMGDELVVHYVLRTARTWGDGRIRRLRIEFDDQGLLRKNRWNPSLRPNQIQDGGRHLVWNLAAFAPKQDLALRFEERDDHGQWQ
jgi:hypothetical protein